VIRQLNAEIFKLRSTRTFYALTGGVLGLILLIVIPVMIFADIGSEDEPLPDMLGLTLLVQVASLVLGILCITSEFRHGTITPSLLVVPNRVKLTLAKLAASLVSGIALGLVAAALVWLVVKSIGSVRDLDTSGDALSIVIGGTLASGLAAAFGLAVGAIMRNQVGAIVTCLVYIFVLENLLRLIPGLDDVLAKYGLVAVSTGLFGGGNDLDQLGQVSCGLLFAGYCAVLLIVGIELMRHRDITA
jgi:ABC-2 type transport system permease protein